MLENNKIKNKTRNRQENKNKRPIQLLFSDTSNKPSQNLVASDIRFFFSPWDKSFKNRIKPFAYMNLNPVVFFFCKKIKRRFYNFCFSFPAGKIKPLHFSISLLGMAFCQSQRTKERVMSYMINIFKGYL